jgi:hypothetical protein
MRSTLIAFFSMASLLNAQMPRAFIHASFQDAIPPLPAVQAPAPVSAHTLTLTAGTAIPLTLISPIKKKSTTPGDAVRATVAFPIMAGMQVAIPAGSYVEGVVKTVTARASDTQQPAVGIHFTRLVFANGYSVSLDANSTQAEDFAPRMGATGPELATLTPPAGSMGLFAQTSSTLAPLPQAGPPMGVVIGASLGGTAALLAILFAVGHHSQSKMDYVLFDAGWQFQMVLQSPLVVDAGQVAAAAAAPTTN